MPNLWETQVYRIELSITIMLKDKGPKYNFTLDYINPFIYFLRSLISVCFQKKKNLYYLQFIVVVKLAIFIQIKKPKINA